MPEPHAAGDAVPAGCERIEVRVDGLRQLFNAIDPSPFRKRDLDGAAEAFIVEWAREAPRDAPLALVVHLGRAQGPPDEAAALGDAVRDYFVQRAAAERRRLRLLFRQGRTSLFIGLLFLAACIAAGDAAASALAGQRMGEVLRESLLIGGWVAMWRPLEIFLYDWWPIRAEARLFDRLGAMPVRVDYEGAPGSDAWRSDWPARPAGDR